MTGRRFGPYRLEALLGRGGMGEVWRAVDTSHGDRVVAVKVLGAWLAGDAEFGQRFRRESALAASLVGPHIVPIHRYGEIDGRHYIEMQLVEGTDLATLVSGLGPLPPARTCGIVAQVAQALATAHGAGLVHRDVKPSNILVRTHLGADHAYLIDFGIARAVGATQISVTGAVVGTLSYMAPERFVGEGDHRADVYALGCVLHEALSGQKAFPGTNPLILLNAHQNVVPPAPSTLCPGIDPALDAVVARALAKDPDDRFQSVTEFAEAASHAAAPSTVVSVAGPILATPAQPAVGGDRPGLTVGLVAVAAVVAVALGVVVGSGALGGGGAGTAPPPVAPTTVAAPGPGAGFTRFALHTSEVTALAMVVLDQRPVAVSGADDGTVLVWDATSGAVMHRLAGPGRVDVLTTAQLDGRPVMVAGGSDRAVDVWDVATGRHISRMQTAEAVAGLATTELDGRAVVVSQGSLAVEKWDLATGAPVGEAIRHEVVFDDSVAVTRLGGRPVLVRGENGNVRVRDLRTGEPVGAAFPADVRGDISIDVAIAEGHDGPVVVVTAVGSITMFELATGEPVGQLMASGSDFFNGAVVVPSEYGPTTIVSGGRAAVGLWDANGMPVGSRIPPPDTEFTSIAAINPDGGVNSPMIIAGTTDGAVCLWDVPR